MAKTKPRTPTVTREPGLGVSVNFHSGPHAGRHVNFMVEGLANAEYIKRAALNLADEDLERQRRARLQGQDEPQAAQFVCGTCRRLMCDDCTSMAHEYEHLLAVRTGALMQAQLDVERLQRELADAQRHAEIWKDGATVGFNDVITAWLNDVEAKAFAKGRREMRSEMAAINKKFAQAQKKLAKRN